MGALSGLIWFVAFLVGVAAILIFLFIAARIKYIKSGQEEGE